MGPETSAMKPDGVAGMSPFTRYNPYLRGVA